MMKEESAPFLGLLLVLAVFAAAAWLLCYEFQSTI